MSNIVVTDHTFADLAIERGILEPLGHRVEGFQCKREDELIACSKDADQVITQFAPVTAEVIDRMERARVIVRYGIGVDNVDLAAAAARGIPVCNIPDYCIDEVADHTLALLLALTRRVVTNHRAIAEGGWNLAVPLPAMKALSRMTVGVVGYGRIGRGVCRRLQAFGARVLVYDPLVDAGEAAVTLDTLLAQSEVVTLHCPSTEDTRQLIGADELAVMPQGALLINASRGDLVDTEALLGALESGHLGGAGLDVCDPEPLPNDHPLRSRHDVVITAHVASASAAAVQALREGAAGIAAKSAAGEALPNVVNGVAP